MAETELKFVITAEAAEALARLRETQAQLRGIGPAAQQAAGGARALSGELGTVRDFLGGVVTGAGAAVAAFVSFQAIAATLRGTVLAFAEAERQQLVLRQTIQATGGAAGQTAESIERMVQRQARAGAASEEAVRGAATQLLTFRSVSGEVFERTLNAAVDLSAVGFGSVQSAAVQLGKAMEDPVKGLSSLTEVGVSFTAQQKQVIQSLVDTGRTAEAQALILEAVEGQVGGAGAAQGAGLTGAFRALGHELGEFGETVGGQIADLIGLDAKLRAVAGGVGQLRQMISGRDERSDDQIREEIARLTAARDALAATLQDLPGTVGGALALDLGSAESEVERLAASWRELRDEIERSRDEGYSDDRPESRVLVEFIEAADALRLAERRAAEIRASLSGLDAEDQAPVGSFAAARDLSALEAALAAEEALLAASIERRLDAERRAAEEQEKIRQGRIEGVVSGLEAEAAAARMTRQEAEAQSAARRAGVTAETDPEVYQRILTLVREITAAKAEQAGLAQLAEWQEKARLAEVEATFGRESVEATRAAAQADRDALAAKLEALGVAEELAARILDARDAAVAFAGVDMAGPIARARAEAREMAGEINRAIAATAALQARSISGLERLRLQVEMRDNPVGLAGELAFREMVAAQGVRREGAEGLELAALDAEAVAARRRAEEEERLRAELARRPAASQSAAGAGGGGGAASLTPRETLAELQGEVASLLAALDLSVDQINARVDLGLTGVAEGQDAIAAAKARTAGELADLLPQLDAFGAAGESAMERVRAAVAELGVALDDDLGKKIAAAADRIDQAGEDAFVDWVKNGGDAAAALVDVILTEFLKLTYQQTVGGLLGNLVNSLFSGLFSGFGFGGGGLGLWAKGGVPELGEFGNRIVSAPTLFAMGGGQTGLMSEAGVEAILPLVGSPAAPAVRAVMAGGDETAVPLSRARSGHLAVVLPEALAPIGGAVRGVPIPFAMGGVPALGEFGNRIVSAPTLFAMGGGQTGLMSEAGVEAILPLVGSPAAPAVRAVMAGGDETAVPLSRARSGHLAVVLPEASGPEGKAPPRGAGAVRATMAGLGLDAMPPGGWAELGALRDALAPVGGAAVPRAARFALGGVPGGAVRGVPIPFATGGIPARLTETLSASRPGATPAAAVVPQLNVRLNVVNNAARGDEEVTVSQGSEGGDTVMQVVIDRVEAQIAAKAARGQGPLARMLGDTFGLRRVGR